MNNHRPIIPPGVEEQRRWSGLLSFLEEWNRSLTLTDGIPLHRVETAERRLGFRLPVALREWYLLSGKRSSNEVSKTNFLLLPEELTVSEGVLDFYVENQFVVVWGILEDDLASDDPSVLVGGDWEDEYSPPRSGWIKENNSVSEFIFQMEVMDTIAYAEISTTCQCDEAVADTIRQQYEPFGFPKWHWPVYPTEFYHSTDLLVELYDNHSFVLAGRNEIAFRRAIEQCDEI